jgi:hypothetical protein
MRFARRSLHAWLPLLRTTFLIAQVSVPAIGQQLPTARGSAEQIGFDRNDYPGDAALPVLRKHFSFAGYWLTNPPGETSNSWLGKRDALLKQGFGFLVLANGKDDAVILKAMKTSKTSAEAVGRRDAEAVITTAKQEHFPAGTILFLDQEEGGRLLPEQADYLFGWTEAVSRSPYKAGAYVSGQAVPDGPGKTITTAQDIRTQIAAKQLHPVALWVYDDGCPPSNGCTLRPPSLKASGTPGAVVWQYAQSPRRKEITASCAKTYAADGNCYLPDLPGMHLDLSVADSSDPSHGR